MMIRNTSFCRLALGKKSHGSRRMPSAVAVEAQPVETVRGSLSRLPAATKLINSMVMPKKTSITQFIGTTVCLILVSHLTTQGVFGTSLAIFLAAIYGSFFVIQLVDIASQVIDEPIPDVPMLLILGTCIILYSCSGIAELINMTNRKKQLQPRQGIPLFLLTVSDVSCITLSLLESFDVWQKIKTESMVKTHESDESCSVAGGSGDNR